MMKKGLTTLVLLTSIFLMAEIFFNYIVLTDGNGDILGASIKTSLFFLFIFLFSKRLNWAKWILSISLILYGLLCLIAAYELMAVFFLIGMYDIFFGIYILKSKVLSEFRNDNVVKLNKAATLRLTDNRKKFVVNGSEFRSPTLVRRFKALLIDGLLLLSILIIIMILVNESDLRTPIMISSSLIVSLTYEPFLTSYSRTIGQRLMNIRVRRHGNPNERISLFNAYLRCFIKDLLGWISFISIHFNSERRAIHDLASGSVMIIDE